MSLYIFSMIVAITGTLSYHLVQKSIHAEANPVASLVVTYVAALAISLVALPFFPHRDGFAAALASLNWASWALGGAIVLIEIGFLLVYRAGWSLSVAPAFAMSTVALILVPIGLLAFREPLTGQRLLGIGFAVAALVLLR